MSGHHRPNAHQHAHDHHRSDHAAGLMIRPLPRLRSRRAFLGDLGGGAVALAVLTPVAVVACSSDDSSESADSTPTTSGSADAGEDSTTSTAAPAESDRTVATDGGGGDTSELRWQRANLGFVSAYVVARGNRAAIVDTGTAGSAETIGQSLTDLGLTYADVESVILTHNHGDHIGSIGDVLAMAGSATAYAGEADLGGIDGDITGLVGGEDVFGMEMLATPGHTPGSISVIDHGTGLLIAGDALVTEGGQPAEPPAQFTADAEGARDSIRELAALSFNTLLVGHGDPIEGGADQTVADLAASF